MEQNELIAIQLKMKNTATFWRGWYINEFTSLEIFMSEYISRYFCHDINLGKDLMELILVEKTTFDTKRFAFDFILKKNNPEIIIGNPNITKDIQKLMEMRNVLAHYMVDTTEAGMQLVHENKLGFVKFNHKNSPNIIYSNDFVIEQINKISTYGGLICTLLS